MTRFVQADDTESYRWLPEVTFAVTVGGKKDTIVRVISEDKWDIVQNDM